jgi:hypothetical protein
MAAPWAASGVAKIADLCHKRPFVARLIKGCRGNVHADFLDSEKFTAFSTL